MTTAKSTTNVTNNVTDKVTDSMASAANSAVAAVKSVASAAAGTLAAKGAHAGDDRGLRLAALRDLTDVSVSLMPDVRGWKLELTDGMVAGSVSRIILDQRAKNMPRYLDIALDPKLFKGAKPHSNELLVPVGLARIAKDRDVILLPSMTRDTLVGLPMLSPGAISFEHEANVIKGFGVSTSFSSADQLYGHAAFDLKSFLSLRPLTR